MKTKKNRFNNILKFGIFLFGISLLLWNCENHNDESLIEPQNNIKIDTIFSIDIDAKVSKLKKKLVDKFIDYQDNYSIKNGKITRYNFRQTHGFLSNKVFSVYKEGDTYPIIIIPFLKKGKGNKLLIGYVKNETYQYKIFRKSNIALIGSVEGVEKDILNKLDLYFEIIYKTKQNSYNRGARYCDYYAHDKCKMSITCETDDGGFSYRVIDTCGKMDGDGDEDDEWNPDPIDPIDLDPIGIDPSDPSDKWEFGSGNGSNEDGSVDKIILDPSFENSVANCVFNLLKANKQFNQILDKLIPKNSKYDVKFKVGTTSGSGGNTTATHNPLKNDITVTISKNMVDTGSIISIAETILHESVHARLYEMVKSIGGLNKLSEFTDEISEIGKLAACYNKYRNKQRQHEFIWDNYVNEIAKGTEAIHKLFPNNYNQFHNYMQGTTGYSKNTFYQSVAKAGLSKTSYYKNLSTTIQGILGNMASKLKSNGEKITNSKTCE